MKDATPHFTTSKDGKRVFLNCSNCKKTIRELGKHESVNVNRGYYCDKCDDGVIRLNMAGEIRKRNGV